MILLMQRHCIDRADVQLQRSAACLTLFGDLAVSLRCCMIRDISVSVDASTILRSKLGKDDYYFVAIIKLMTNLGILRKGPCAGLLASMGPQLGRDSCL